MPALQASVMQGEPAVLFVTSIGCTAAAYLGLVPTFRCHTPHVLRGQRHNCTMSPRRRAPGSPKSLSGDHPRSLCSDGAAGSGRDCSSQRKKRRHPVARVKGNWLPDEDDRLRQYVTCPDPLISSCTQ